MIFTQTPQNGASLYAPLIYEFGDEKAPRDLQIDILDATSRKLIATKQLYNTSSGRIDIAPLLRRYLKWEPEIGAMGFFEAPNRFAHVLVRVEGISVMRYFLPCVVEPLQRPLLSSFPLNRLLAHGEGEELLLDRDVLYVEVERFTPEGSVSELFFPDSSDLPICFRFSTEGMEPEVERAEVRISSTTHEVVIGYTLTNPIPGGVRVAWVGRGGSIEHYTFPILEQRSETQERKVLSRGDAGEELLQSCYREHWQLLSAYETPERMQALAELGTAQQVWIVSPEAGYIPVEVEAEERKILHRGLLTALRFTLSKPLKTIGRWN